MLLLISDTGGALPAISFVTLCCVALVYLQSPSYDFVRILACDSHRHPIQRRCSTMAFVFLPFPQPLSQPEGGHRASANYP